MRPSSSDVNRSLARPICRPPPARPRTSSSWSPPGSRWRLKTGSLTPATLSFRTRTRTRAWSRAGASVTRFRKSPAAHTASEMLKVAPCMSFATVSLVCAEGQGGGKRGEDTAAAAGAGRGGGSR
jgi:hypothetical protein